MTPDRLHVYEFDRFVAEVKLPSRNPGRNSSENRDNAFNGTACYADALSLLENGWPEGLATMKRVTELQERRQALGIAIVPEFDVAGDETDIGRFVSGEPENMVTFQPQYVPKTGRVVKLVFNVGASAGVSKEAIIRRGAATIALADAIESVGLRVEIWIGLAASAAMTEHTLVKVKSPDQPLELDRLAFLFAHPSTLRRLFFRLLERQREPSEFTKFSNARSYGAPAELPCEEDDIYIGTMHLDHLKDDAACDTFVRETLAKYTL